MRFLSCEVRRALINVVDPNFRVVVMRLHVALYSFAFASDPNDGMVSQPRSSSVLVADSRLVFGYLFAPFPCDIGQHFCHRLFLGPFFLNRFRGVHHGSGKGVRQSAMPGDHCPKGCIDACTGGEKDAANQIIGQPCILTASH